MTCIVGLADEGSVWIGADSMGADDSWDMQRRAEPKVFQNGEFLMGFTDSFRMGQLLQYALSPPKQHEGQPLMEFLVKDFIQQVRKCLSDGGFSKKEHEVESGGTFLLGFRGILYTVGSDFQIGSAIWGYDAVGCGAKYALGSLASTDGQAAAERIKAALLAAEKHSAGVTQPFHILKLERK